MTEPRSFHDSFVNLTSKALGRALDAATFQVASVAEATATPPMEFKKNAIAFTVSEDMAIAYGWIPDPRPPEVIEAERAEWKRQEREDFAETSAYVAAVDGITDPLARAVLDLHARNGDHYPTCSGCDFSGYEGEAPEWPCTTVEVVGQHHGIEPPRRAVFYTT